MTGRASNDQRGADGDAQEYISAILDVLEDSASDKEHQGGTERAVLNILEDFSEERERVQQAEKALLNILEDEAEERGWLASTQRAVINILDDMEEEKTKVERINAALTEEVAERRRAENALQVANGAVEQTNRELESFSYTVAHDLRAPLRTIDGFSVALLEDYGEQLNEGARAYLDQIRASAQQMAWLIDGLLALSRVSRTELHFASVDLSSMAKAILERLSGNDRGTHYTVMPDMTARVDPRLMSAVLENLLSNAWKFSARSPRRHIEFGCTVQDKERVFFVRDNGAGFDMSYSAKLFAPFQRLHRVSEFEGTGIGLATVQRIIERHGGRIWAESEVGKGATFYFTCETLP